MPRQNTSRKAFRQNNNPIESNSTSSGWFWDHSAITHGGYVAGRFRWPALNACFNTPKIENDHTHQGRKKIR
jgi:hypothetical protein